MMPIRFYAEVESDLDETWLRIAGDDPSAADRFIDAVQRTFSQIAQHPHIGWERPWKHRKLLGVRSWRVEGFPKYLIFYRVEREAVAMIAVLHGARSFERLLTKR